MVVVEKYNYDNKKEKEMSTVNREEYEYTPKEGFVLTHFLTVADVERSAEFYRRIFGGKTIRKGRLSSKLPTAGLF